MSDRRRPAPSDAAGEALEPLRLATFLPYRLSVLANRISRSLAQLYQMRFGLSVPEWRVMAVLGEEGGLAANEVAERTAMDKVAVSRAVKRLVRDGRVLRRRHAADQRRSQLRLSARGRAVYAEIVPLARRFEADLLAALDPELRRSLRALLDGLDALEGLGRADPDGQEVDDGL